MRIRSNWRKSGYLLPIIILNCAFLVIVLRRAWLCDDAYITFRTVDNFVNGYGLTWNVAERVQAYTHPMWMFLISIFYFFTHELYLTSIYLSVFLASLAVIVFSLRVARSATAALFGVLVLCLSNPFTDYATSGLESPLSYLLGALFYAVLFAQNASPRRLFLLSLLASLAGFNRLDTVLLYAPALLYAWWEMRSRKAALLVMLGQMPLILWELFSIIYYGFPFPNTYYAKLHTGIPASELIVQGWYYVLDTVQRDPLTTLVILSGLVVAFTTKDRRSNFAGLGVILYIIYIVKIGGDFMSGRFFTLPLLGAVSVMAISPYFDLGFDRLAGELATTYLKPSSLWAKLFGLIPTLSAVILYAVVLIIGLRGTQPTIRPLNQTDGSTINARGISDERLAYAKWTAPFTPEWRSEPALEDVGGGRSVRAQDKEQVIVRKNIGVFGFYAGSKAFIVDEYALTDPLLARLPAVRTVGWRIGHFWRVVPQDYVETLQSGTNQISDPGLAHFYDSLVLITRGNLFDPQRLSAIWSINIGQFDHLIDFDAYRYPDMVFRTLAEVSADGAGDEPSTAFTASGLEISLGEVSHAETISVSLDSNDQYQLIYFLDGVETASQKTPQLFAPLDLAEYHLQVPTKAVSSGYDRIRILPFRGDNYNNLGSLSLKPPP